MQAVGSLAWLLGGAMDRPGPAQEPGPPAVPPVTMAVPVEGTVQPIVPVQPMMPVQPNPATWNGRTEASPLTDVILESLFGEADPDLWRPLPLSTLFSEGWREPWVPSPNGSGGAPRQGWINALDGNLYRLWFFTFAQGFNQASKGNAYLGAYTLYARR
jgi:hypothetical protein